MEYREPSSTIKPRLIIHGGAGNILPSNFSPEKHKEYHFALLRILAQTSKYQNTTVLSSSHNRLPSAIDVVTYAVTLLENNPLFNSGHGAVFTRDGINELEASLMVSRGKKKRGVGVMGLRHVKNPIKLAREMLLHGEEDIELGNGEHRQSATEREILGYSSGAQAHCQLHRESAEKLAKEWGLEVVEPGYFFTQTRWDEHIKGLKNEKIALENGSTGCATWSAEDYFPQGTCGAVALDSEGVLAVATSTGGLTNKLTGRIGDTPTLGSGFWAEEWEDDSYNPLTNSASHLLRDNSSVLTLSKTLWGVLADCFPNPYLYDLIYHDTSSKHHKVVRSTAMSGTGNGDSFLRTNAVRTASAIARYRPSTTLQAALSEIVAKDGELQKSAGDRWGKTGEGEGGVIGIEFTAFRNVREEVTRTESEIVFEYNCGGLFRAFVRDDGKAESRTWRRGQHEGIEKDYPWEFEVYDLRDWADEKSVYV